MKTAILLGATGMVGAALLKQLLANDLYSSVLIFVRRSTQLNHAKLTEYVVDFDQPEQWSKQVQGDVLFSCLGTTLAVAGSKVNQYKVDFTYQYEMAKIASENSVKSLVLVSSAGAKATSSNFYLSMKGRLDETVQQLNFRSVIILRPGQLYGNRLPKRPMEEIAIKVMFLINRIGLLRSYRPIHADEVAQAMQQVAKSNQNAIYTLGELFEIK
jgi:uncharacterized protein YbjT (DUF2867 family)